MSNLILFIKYGKNIVYFSILKKIEKIEKIYKNIL
jgi:hypothetical protein